MKIEDVLPMVAELTDKYTSKDSSSVTYETARMLMGAVIYCIKEWERSGTRLPAASKDEEYWRRAYQLGGEAVKDKTYRTKALYEEIINTFESYGCRNYSDTIEKGMPAFFVKYDARYCPQDHILTLDYPLLWSPTGKTGVDLIFDYLRATRIEQAFLNQWSPTRITEVLTRLQPDYRELFLDNICKEVLLVATACQIAGEDSSALQISAEGHNRLQNYFTNTPREAATEQIKEVIEEISSHLTHKAAVSYFTSATEEITTRLLYIFRNNTI